MNGKRLKGKEYNNDGDLIFEGEYLNGFRWNGKGYNKFYGKKRWEENIKIVYELKNGKGVIKEYNSLTGILKFEVEYFNGKRNGKGKEYNEDGKLIFEGEYLNNKILNGKFYNRNNDAYYELKNGKGFIKELYMMGNIYMIKNGMEKDMM